MSGTSGWSGSSSATSSTRSAVATTCSSTFDDGNVSDVTEALPALAERGLSAQVFVCAGRFGTDGFLTEEQVRELRAAGMSIGSHGMDHVRWRKLDEPRIGREVVEAKQLWRMRSPLRSMPPRARSAPTTAAP